MKRVLLTVPEVRAELYAAAVRDCGMEPSAVSAANPVDGLDGFGGLILSGGRDVNPALYGEVPHPRTREPLVERDAFEQNLLRLALQRDFPVLAICRGMQLLNVTHPGGTLIQHIEGHVVRFDDLGHPAHDVSVEPGSHLERILGRGPHPVNSRHHQCVGQIGEGLRATAWSGDGVVEGLERLDRRFVVGVQWHPENMVSGFTEQRNLFLAFEAVL